jgi:hypothetical protein
MWLLVWWAGRLELGLDGGRLIMFITMKVLMRMKEKNVQLKVGVRQYRQALGLDLMLVTRCLQGQVQLQLKNSKVKLTTSVTRVVVIRVGLWILVQSQVTGLGTTSHRPH